LTIAQIPLMESLRIARLRLHRSIFLTSVGLTALLGAVMLVALWASRDHALLGWWAASLAAVLALRIGVAWAHGKSKPDSATTNATWLLRYRLCYAAHGLVWGAAGWVLQDASGPAQFSLLTIGIIAIAAGSLNSTTFDLSAGLAFVGAALSPMVLSVYLSDDSAANIRALIMLTFMLATYIGARRAEKIFVEAESLRVAEAARAEEARQNARAAEVARKELAEKNYLLPLLLRTTRQGFWFVDNDGITLDLNPAMYELLGRTKEEVVGRTVFDLFSGGDLAVMRREIAARQHGAPGNYEITIRRPDGTLRHCVNNATPMHDASGRQTGSVGIWTDITARRESETVLRTYELVANSITDSVSAVGEDLRYRMVNDAWCRMTGRTREEAIGGTTSHVLSAISNAIRKKALQECIEEQEVRVVRDQLQFPGQAPFHAETTYFPYASSQSSTDESARCVVMVTRDISAQEHARQQLTESAEYLQRTLNATGDAIFASDAEDPHEPVRFVNIQMLDMWGIPHDKMKTLSPVDIMAYATPRFQEPELESRRVADIIATNKQDESRVHLRDGRVLLRRCIPARLGEKTLRVWSFRDITAESNVLETMRRSEASQRALLDAFPGFITQTDENFVYTYVNQRVADRLGKSRADMIGRTLNAALDDETATWLKGLVAQLMKGGEPVTYERHHPRDDGFGLYDQVTIALGIDAQTGGKVICSFGIDVTERKRVEQHLASVSQSLMNRTEELQLTLESIDQGIVSFDKAGKVGIHNIRALSLMDLPPDLFDNLNTYDDIVRYQVQRGDLAGDASFVDVYGQHQYFKGGRANSPDLYIRRNASGATIEVRTRHLANGGMVRTFADVTGYFEAQQAVRESEAELRDLLGAFPGYIVATDEHLCYTYANERIATLLGHTPQDIIGREVQEILGKQRADAIQQEILAIKAGQASVGISSYPATATRARLDLEVTHVPGRLKANGAQTVYVFGIDVTARRLAEEALIAARDAAESSSRAKSDFLSHMSHELRTPLNAILGFGQLLELEHQSDQDRLVWGREVVKGGRHLLELINEVLDLARVESGKMAVQLEPMALRPVLEDCLTLMRQQASARSITMSLHLHPQGLAVLADRTRLKQTMLNLLANAVKYNTEAGTVTVVCELTTGTKQGKGDQGVRINITDTGKGLTPTQTARLFQPFERLDANLAHIEGTGIGLALTKRLVELMHGHIGVDSTPGQGSTFWITLPLAG
jgi:PAS domain S-box-containing protein